MAESSLGDDLDHAVRTIMVTAPELDADEVRAELQHYQQEFLIGPRDAIRSVTRKLVHKHGITPERVKDADVGGPIRAVTSFSELAADDRNVQIEVRVTTARRRPQTVRGEERMVGWGRIEDQPHGAANERTTWTFKDWGDHSEHLREGAVVRLEGVSVNEYQGQRSLNINQTSRVVVLEAGREPAVDPDEPVTLAQASELEGPVSVVGRVMSREVRSFEAKDGSGTRTMVKGRLGDASGVLGFTSWVAFDHEPGVLLKIAQANVRRFRDTPELNVGDATRMEVYHDGSFPRLEQLEQTAQVAIADLRDGARDLTLIAQMIDFEPRTITVRGEQRTIWGGELIDPTGRCRLTAWSDPGLDDVGLPAGVRLTGVRVRAWQGIPDVTVDEIEQIEVLDELPWETIDPDEHWIDMPLHELVSGGSRVGVQTTGTVVSMREASGVVARCIECRRVLRDGRCGEHGDVEGTPDLRLLLVLDDGLSTSSIVVAREPTEALLGTSLALEQQRELDDGRAARWAAIAQTLVGRPLRMRGRVIVDGQGAMLMAEWATQPSPSEVHDPAAVRERWGVN